MHFNPCGRAVEMLRAGYVTRARFFRDSDREVPIRWYRCLPNAPTLGFPSAICSLNWDDEPWIRQGPGEVFGAPRPFDRGDPIPAAAGEHYCGTRDQHRNGESFNPALPPTIYAANGLSICCLPDPKRRALGGAVGGGTALVDRHWYVSAYGGSVAGGTAIVHTGPFVRARGGVVAGGTSEDTILYPALASGGGVAGGSARLGPDYSDQYRISLFTAPINIFTRVLSGADEWREVVVWVDYRLWGPGVLGVPGRWEIRNFNTPTFGYRADDWDGQGSRTFNRLPGSGGPSTTTVSVYP